MGGILSRWRKKPSIMESLEKLEVAITHLEECKRHNLARQKKVIGYLLIFSILIYITAALVLYFVYLPERWQDRALSATPLVLFPVIVWLLKRLLHWGFVRRISGNEAELQRKKKEKNEILEDVMEKEVYKKAKEILEKYDPERFKNLEAPQVTQTAPATPATARAPIGQELRNRSSSLAVETPSTSNVPVGSVRPTPRVPGSAPPSTPAASHRITQQQKAMQAAANASAAKRAPPVMPRPILPQDRGFMDRLVEYFVGDGPQNRYALICLHCQAHNGMALKEEFEFIAFRCCYCHAFNPSRKKRPNAPRLFDNITATANQTITTEKKEEKETRPSSADPSSSSSSKSSGDGNKTLQKKQVEEEEEDIEEEGDETIETEDKKTQ